MAKGDFTIISLEGGKAVQFDNDSGQVNMVLGGNESLNSFELDEAREKFAEYRDKLAFDTEVKKVRALHRDPDFAVFAEELRYEKDEEELKVLQENPFAVTREWQEKMGGRGPSPEEEAEAAREAKRQEKRVEVLRADIRSRQEKGWNTDDQLLELMEIENLFPEKK